MFFAIVTTEETKIFKDNKYRVCYIYHNNSLHLKLDRGLNIVFHLCPVKVPLSLYIYI